MRKGFTLIEISIVLVIVGLLIGGVLAARGLVDSAKTQASVKQLGQVEISYSNFKNKYNQPPGDNSKFYASGNNNYMIEDASGTSGLGAEFSGEVANAWVSLQAAGDIKHSSTFTATVSGPLKIEGNQVNIMPAELGNKATGMVLTNDYVARGQAGSLRDAGLAMSVIMGNFQDVTDSALSIAPANIRDSVTTIDMAALDRKLDDGMPLTGSVRVNSRVATCVNGGSYDLSVTSEVCSAVVKMERANPGIASAGSSSSSSSSSSGGCDDECQCDAQGPMYYWDGWSCQEDDTGCGGDAQCQCEEQGHPLQWTTSMGCIEDFWGCGPNEDCLVCENQGHGERYWNGSTCVPDGTGCRGDAQCQCGAQGSPYYWDGNDCVEDLTTCNGDFDCINCNNAGAPYYWIDNTCMEDMNGCGGNHDCIRCHSNFGHFWDGDSCEFDPDFV